MALTLTITITDADQGRLQAALAAADITDPAATITARLAQIVRDYETAAQTATVQAPLAAWIESYAPITPTATITPG